MTEWERAPDAWQTNLAVLKAANWPHVIVWDDDGWCREFQRDVDTGDWWWRTINTPVRDEVAL